MGKVVSFDLPWPPSTNRYYRYVGHRVLISRDGRTYRKAVTELLRDNAKLPLEGPLKLTASFSPPDKRRRDLDNVGSKALLDTLQHAGCFEDDSQIKVIHLEMQKPCKPASCKVTLEEISDASE